MRRGNATRKLWPLALFVLPVVLVKAAAMTVFDIDQPRSAKAAVPAPATDPAYAPLAKRQWTTQELAVAQHVQNLRNRPFGATPMLYEDSARVKSPPAVKSSPAESRPEPSTQSTRFTLQAVIASSAGYKAVINGTPYVVGDRIRGTTWMVNDIDLHRRTVILRDSTSGGTLELGHNRSRTGRD